MLAINAENYSMATLLLAHGASATIKDNVTLHHCSYSLTLQLGNTAMSHMAVPIRNMSSPFKPSDHPRINIVLSLLEAGSDLYAINKVIRRSNCDDMLIERREHIECCSRCIHSENDCEASCK